MSKEYVDRLKYALLTFERDFEEGVRRVLSRQLARKFGPLPDLAQRRLQEWPLEQLNVLADRLIDAHSLIELGLADG